jgi:hypothetical protein
MPEAVTDEYRVRRAREDAPRSVAQAVELDAPESGDLAAAVVAATQRRVVEPASPATANHVVILADEVGPRAQPGYGRDGVIGQRHESGPTALRLRLFALRRACA